MSSAFFLCPYETVESGRRPYRRCAMDILSPDIEADGGEWQESEIDGNAAIVKVRASDVVLARIEGEFRKLEDPSAEWLPFRAKPRFSGGEIILDGPRVASLPLEIIDAKILKDEDYGTVRRKTDAYIALSIERGYIRVTEREPEKSMILALAAKAGFGLDKLSTGTFPTTSVIDSFTRADQNPIASGWLGPVWSGDSQARVVSNVMAGQASSFGNSYYNTSFGPASEAYITISTKPENTGSIEVGARLVNVNSAVDGYVLRFVTQSGTDQVLYIRLDNEAETQLGATVSQEFAAGDGLGLEIILGVLQAYRRDAGVWAALSTSRSDATYSAAGFISAHHGGAGTVRGDDFGGGTVVAGETITMDKWGSGFIPRRIPGRPELVVIH